MFLTFCCIFKGTGIVLIMVLYDTSIPGQRYFQEERKHELKKKN